MKREEGFYWVKSPTPDSAWMVAFWDNLFGWYLVGIEYPIPDGYWSEVGERVERLYS